MKSLPKQYDHLEAEARLQALWEREGVHAWNPEEGREANFVVDTPPPTVSGVLHMGHVFSYTQADFVARYQRMTGKNVFYPMGFDDNGLPTERLVEKIKGKKAAAYESREAFIADCREVVAGAEEEFRALFRSIALSVDWKQEYQTVSDEVVALSQASFIELLQKGEAYRDFRPTYWDWVDQTAIAQAEIENKEMQGAMYDVEFRVQRAEGREEFPIVIATTRPELLGACVAVMYHPEDSNAAKYKDAHAVTPLFGVKVPMIADEAVDKEFGSGLVMCCTFGDDTDKEWWRKYKLPMRPALKQDGKIDFENELFVASFTKEELDSRFRGNDKAQALQGLKPKQAHAKIVELLTAENKILKQTNITHTVKCAERSGTPIEIIPTHQWFIRITDKQAALKEKSAACDWHPEFMKLRLDQWIDGLKEDWCISRQRFFGVPFPVWYARERGDSKDWQPLTTKGRLPVNPMVDLPKGISKITEGYKVSSDRPLPDDILAINKAENFRTCITTEDIFSINGELLFKANTEIAIKADIDVMDTWATSSLTPQISARALAPGNGRYEKLFPADIRPQAHEIIRSWAFYTIVKAYLHADSIPWKHLMISGWCLAADKSKMSKSKGNVVTPVSLIHEKSSDAVRYWASTSRLGADTAFSEDLLKIGRKLVTKLWNAANFVALQLESLESAPKLAPSTPLDKWIITRLSHAVEKAGTEFARFEYCDARLAVEDFFWNDFCDNYLELVKARAYEKDPSALSTLYHCLHTVLRLFAPFVPHVTEEIYQHLFPGASVHARGNWPQGHLYPRDSEAEAAGIAAVEVLAQIRKTKSEAGVSIKFPVARIEVPQELMELIAPLVEDIKAAGSVTGDIVAGAALIVQLAEKDAVA